MGKAVVALGNLLLVQDSFLIGMFARTAGDRFSEKAATKKVSKIKLLILGQAVPFDTPTIKLLALRMLGFLHFERRFSGVDAKKEKSILDHLNRASLPTNRGNLHTKAVQ